MKKGTIGAVIGLLVAASLLMAGCGGGNDDANSSLTRAEFLKQGNALCKKGEERRGALIRKASAAIEPGQKFTDADRAKMILVVIIPPYRETIEKLDALGAPEGEEEKVDEIISAMEEAAEKVEANPAPAVKNVTQWKEANELAAKYGLTSCVI